MAPACYPRVPLRLDDMSIAGVRPAVCSRSGETGGELAGTAAVGRILDRVGQQIAQHLLELAGVAGGRQLLWQIGAEE